MATAPNRYQPDYAVPPGQVIEEWLTAEGTPQAEFARRCGRSAKLISEIIAGKALVEPRTALHFEKVLGMDAGIWLGIEADYRLGATGRTTSSGSASSTKPPICSSTAKRRYSLTKWREAATTTRTRRTTGRRNPRAAPRLAAVHRARRLRRGERARVRRRSGDRPGHRGREAPARTPDPVAEPPERPEGAFGRQLAAPPQERHTVDFA